MRASAVWNVMARTNDRAAGVMVVAEVGCCLLPRSAHSLALTTDYGSVEAGGLSSIRAPAFPNTSHPIYVLFPTSEGLDNSTH